MMKRFISVLTVIMMIVLSVSFVVPALDVQAAAKGICDNSNADAAAKAAAGCNDTQSVNTIVQNILTIVYWAIVVVAVVVIIIGGLTYVTSTGDPGKTAKAKAAITVAVVGLVIMFLASAIINFVIDTLAK